MIHDLILKGLKKTGFKERYEGEINNLLEAAPSDSSASSEIVKLKGGYSGILQIFSAEGKFGAHARCERLDDLVKALVGQMNKHIKSWKRCRLV